ncbi:MULTISPECIES: urease accessory protein UreD [Protofrankia]|uniref:Urease accessory protein UreD n=1 Tax=Candidatus Protofrankia datiscae TaxID=2716812 RepID=F8AZK1_9ACTN|nr:MULTISPECIES: urease accessory protein UreD [Protofrankia]AEH08678.1 Urease accessory protein ureD [Candidatus Protofrankia datiscae]
MIDIGPGRPPARIGRTSISAHAVIRIEPVTTGSKRDPRETRGNGIDSRIHGNGANNHEAGGRPHDRRIRDGRIQAAGVRVSELRSQVPLVLRRTGSRTRPGDGLPTVTVYLVNAAAGPLAGDQLRLDVTVGAGVRLVLRTTAATVALPGRDERPSLFDVHADVGPGGALEYLPEPTVAAHGCRHLMRATIRLAADARLLWREEIVLGRFGEPPGSISSTLRVDVEDDTADEGSAANVTGSAEDDVRSIPDGVRNGTDGIDTNTGSRPGGGTAGAADNAGAGDIRRNDGAGRRVRSARPLLRQALCLDAAAPGLHGPAVLGGARVIGALLIAGPGPDGLGLPAGTTGTIGPTGGGSPTDPTGSGADASSGTGTFAALPLAGPGVLVSALASGTVALRRCLDTGAAAVPPQAAASP